MAAHLVLRCCRHLLLPPVRAVPPVSSVLCSAPSRPAAGPRVLHTGTARHKELPQPRPDTAQPAEGPRAQHSKAQPSKDQPSKAQPSKAQPSKAQPSKAQPSKAQLSKDQPSKDQPVQGSQAQPSKAQPVQGSQAQPSKAQPLQAQHGLAQPTDIPQAQLSKAQPAEGPQAQPSKAQPVQGSQAQPSKAQPVQGSQAQPGPAQPLQAPQAWPNPAQPPQAQPSKAQPVQAQHGLAQPTDIPQAQPSKAQPAEVLQAQPSKARPTESPQAQPNPAQPVQAQHGLAQPTDIPQAQPSKAWPTEAPQPQHGSAQPAEVLQAQPSKARPTESPQAQPNPAQPVQAQPNPAQPVQAQPNPAQPVQAQHGLAQSTDIPQAQPSKAWPTESPQAQPSLAQSVQAQPGLARPTEPPQAQPSRAWPTESPQPRPSPARPAEVPPEQQQHLRELIQVASGPQELLQLSGTPGLSSNLAALAIARLARLARQQHLEGSAIRGDPRFQQLLSTVDGQISQVWNTPLVHLLQSLSALGLPGDGRQVRSVEQEVLWRLRRLSLRQLVHLAEHLAGQAQDSPLLPEVLRKLELRWAELDGPRPVVTLMAKVGHLSPALMERLEDKALELAEHLDPEQVRRVVVALALQQRRCVPLLRALSYHLLQKPAQLHLAVITDLLFAYSKLSFQQPQVLHRLALELQPHLGSLSPAQVSRCARSFASLRWLNRPLAESIAQYSLDSTQHLSLTQLCGILVSFARLNFQPSSSQEFFSMVHERLQGQEQQLDVHLLTGVVWALCVLQQPRHRYLRQVLSPEFHTQLRGDPSPRAQGSWLKLLHINATARLEATGYQGPFLPPEALPGDRDKDRDKDKATPLQRGLREALPVALGGHDLVRYDVNTVYGWDIDAEVVLDSDNKPLPLRDFSAPHLSQCQGTKPLPAGARRLAVLRWELSQFSSRGRELLGRGSLARRHLRAAGFLLAEVPHYEFLELKLERQRVAYLKDKVAKALASDTAGDTATDTAT